MRTKTEENLFLSEALDITKNGKPYWYTSGKIGPFFMNTHYLYGGMLNAGSLLDFINNEKENPNFVSELENIVMEFYNKNNMFKNTIDELYDLLKKDDNFINADIISGGERRDWFFSIMIAKLSDKKHLYIFKDLSIIDNQMKKITDLSSKNIFHIADLITLASSYFRAWIPAIKNTGGTITGTAAVVDRNQGGIQLLNDASIPSQSLITMDDAFYKRALENGNIDEKQYQIITDFLTDPDAYGKKFIINNPEFLNDSIKNAKCSSKAQRCIDENPYNIDNIKSLLQK